MEQYLITQDGNCTFDKTSKKFFEMQESLGTSVQTFAIMQLQNLYKTYRNI